MNETRYFLNKLEVAYDKYCRKRDEDITLCRTMKDEFFEEFEKAYLDYRKQLDRYLNAAFK